MGPLNCHSDFTIQKSCAKIDTIVERCKNIGYKHCVLSDIETLAGSVKFAKAAKKEGLLPVIGIDFDLSGSRYTVLAKNKSGFNSLVQATSAANARWNKRPVYALEDFCGDNTILICDEERKPDSEHLFRSVYTKNELTYYPSYYCEQADAHDQRTLLAANLRTTLSSIDKAKNKSEDVVNFLRSFDYYIRTSEDLLEQFSTAQIGKTEALFDSIEDYKLSNKPLLPQYGENPDAELRQLCRDGWAAKIAKQIPKHKHTEYADRVKKELDVISGANLASYFLIVADYVNWARSKTFCCMGRGSAAGSLVSYLIGITMVDPIPYNLMFERFYNAGRNTKDHVALPDIDSDFPTSIREDVIEYIKNKYGHENVGQLATYGRMQGRAAIKDVFTVHEACSFAEINRITEFVPDESKIADELQEMRDNGLEPSIIKWALEHNSSQLAEWCTVDDSGALQGQYSRLFEQAMRLEGVIRSQGKHAAGLIISSVPLKNLCPMIYDKSADDPICGMDMKSLEDMGLVKVDILGVAVYDKLMGVQALLGE